MGALAIGSLTSPVHADPSSLDNDYQIIVIEKDPATGKYVQKITYTEHAYFGTTGFCNICNMTINEGNHTNKLVKDEDIFHAIDSSEIKNFKNANKFTFVFVKKK